MKPTFPRLGQAGRATGWSLTAITLLALVAGPACGGKRVRTPYMETADQVTVTAAELRVYVYDYASLFASAVEATADEILSREDDPGVRAAALRWKINALPRMQRAVFQTDPLAALQEAWGLTFQMLHFFEKGRGRRHWSGLGGQHRRDGPRRLRSAHALRGEAPRPDALARRADGGADAGRLR
jgi:hypothetical protein